MVAIKVFCSSCQKKTIYYCFDDRMAKFRCASCWDITKFEYAIRGGLDLLKPKIRVYDYSKIITSLYVQSYIFPNPRHFKIILYQDTVEATDVIDVISGTVLVK